MHGAAWSIPQMAAGMRSYLYPLANAKEINEGKAKPETLGVVADGPFTLRVTLKSPAAHFFKLATSENLAPVPRHAIERHGRSWTRPGLMPSCGPYLLHEWRPYERVVLRKNPRYHAASRRPPGEICFFPIVDGATAVNLYKAGDVYTMHGRAVPPLWIPALRGRRRLYTTPAYRSLFYAFNTTKPPFDNVLVRYAFQMATNTHAVTRVPRWRSDACAHGHSSVRRISGYPVAFGRSRRPGLGCALVRSRRRPGTTQDREGRWPFGEHDFSEPASQQGNCRDPPGSMANESEGSGQPDDGGAECLDPNSARPDRTRV